MASVHPSRLGLVPGGSTRPAPPPTYNPNNGEPSTSREEELRRRLMDRKRHNGDERESSSRGRDRDEDRRDRRDGDREERRDRSDRHDRDREDRGERGDRRDREEESKVRDRDGEGFRSYDSRRDERDRRDRDRGDRRKSPDYSRKEDDRPRRSSPTYKPYDGQQPPPPTLSGEGYGYGRRDDLPGGIPPPWRPGMLPPNQNQNQGYGQNQGQGQRPNWQNPPPHQRFGTIDFERRRQERENNPLSIWPDSPKRPYQDEDELEAERKKNKKSKSKSSKKSKSSSKHKSSKHRSSRKYSDSSSSETDSEEESRRRRRRKEKERERRKRYDSESESDSEERRRKRRKSKSYNNDDDNTPKVGKEEDLADQWVEKGGEVVLIPTEKDRHKVESHIQKSPVTEKVVMKDDESDEEIGPQLPGEAKDRGMDRSAFAHMRPGEGEAMALYAESGQRIPRRGEIGMEAETIEKFEQSGYVMSGSRHQRMNAVRMRKENQVINEAEKRAILKLQKEEKEKKEGMIITQFKEMMEENLRKQGINRP